MLIEMCCKCGFIHKDDRLKIGDKPYRCYKPHYHWIPSSGELNKNGVTLHATICVGCCGEFNWMEFFEQKDLTPEKYRVSGSLNAPLPEKYLSLVSELYLEQCKYFQFY